MLKMEWSSTSTPPRQFESKKDHRRNTVDIIFVVDRYACFVCGHTSPRFGGAHRPQCVVVDAHSFGVYGRTEGAFHSLLTRSDCLLSLFVVQLLFVLQRVGRCPLHSHPHPLDPAVFLCVLAVFWLICGCSEWSNTESAGMSASSIGSGTLFVLELAISICSAVFKFFGVLFVERRRLCFVGLFGRGHDAMNTICNFLCFFLPLFLQ